MGKTMKKAEVVFGGDKHVPKITLQQWSQLAKLANNLANGKPAKLPDAKRATQLAKKQLEDGALSEAYCKLGWVGSNLVFRIKSKGTGVIKKLAGHNEQDFVIGKNTKPEKNEKSSSGDSTTTIVPKQRKYCVLSSGYLSKPLSDMLDIGRGYFIDVAAKIEGSEPSKSFQKLLVADLNDLQESYRSRVEAIIDDLQKDVLTHTGGTIDDVKRLVDQVDGEIRSILDEKKIKAAVDSVVKKRLQNHKQDDKKRQEWKVRSFVKVSTSTAKFVISGARLWCTQGADVRAWATLVSTALSIKGVYDDYNKNEPKLRKELETAIDDFEEAAKNVYGAVQGIYDEVKDAGETKVMGIDFGGLGALINSGSRIAAAAKGKLVKGFEKICGFEISATEPENKRNRYHVYLSKQRKKLDKLVKRLEPLEKRLKGSQLKVAVGVWPAYQAFKKASDSFAGTLREQETYAAGVKTRLVGLGIQVSDKTTLDKLRDTWNDIKALKLEKVLTSDGAVAMANLAPTIKTVVDLVKKL